MYCESYKPSANEEPVVYLAHSYQSQISARNKMYAHCKYDSYYTPQGGPAKQFNIRDHLEWTLGKWVPYKILWWVASPSKACHQFEFEIKEDAENPAYQSAFFFETNEV